MTSQINNPTLRRILLSSSLLIPAAYGAGFQIAERSAVGLGRAFSGEAAMGDNASVLASNPAAMVLLAGDWNYAFGASYINPDADATLFPAVTGGNAGPALRNQGIAEDAIIPHAYLTKRLNENLVVGVGAFASFGLSTNYSSEVAERIATDDSEVVTLTILPSLGYRINDQLSVGLGLGASYTDGKLTSQQITGFPAPTNFLLEGDTWSFTYNVGVLFEPTKSTRIGLNYRSELDVDLDGDGEFGPFVDDNATLSVELPATVELSIAHDICKEWTVHGDILWTGWSAFESLNPSVAGVPDGALEVRQDWDDTFRYSLGATYRPNDTWTLRAGVAYDESPAGDELRTLRIPDGDRFWLALGASYKLNDFATINAGYSYIFVDDISLGRNDPTIDTNSIGVGNVQLVSLGMSGSF